IKQLYGDKVKVSELTEEQKQTISTLSTLAAGLAGGIAGDSTASALTGAQAGKNAADNNALGYGLGTFWGQIANSISSDASLSFDLQGKGKTVEEINEAIKYSHQGPSWGVTYKVKPHVKGEVTAGIGPAGFAEAALDPNKFAINGGMTTAIGAHGGATVGIEFGPYFPGLLGAQDKDYSFDLGFGYGSFGISAGKDGIGVSLGIGPSIGWGGISRETPLGETDVNGKVGTEIYKHEFKDK
ncbi:polymorphic toxin type 25 domain-containing protein, partial [Photorhabdus viridis]|uniref:polymorphic toxin type 25 domain-containing protein n=1 Tax=Photorhabdus viridis TaxID=3163327 RepID=UPI003306D46E